MCLTNTLVWFGHFLGSLFRTMRRSTAPYITRKCFNTKQIYAFYIVFNRYYCFCFKVVFIFCLISWFHWLRLSYWTKGSLWGSLSSPYVLCARWCLCLWIVHSRLPLRCSLAFKNNIISEALSAVIKYLYTNCRISTRVQLVEKKLFNIPDLLISLRF